MQPNGTEQPAFWPDPITGTSPILEPLFANDAKTDPRQLFANLFLEPGASDQTVALQARMAMRKSVLDYMARDLSDLEIGPRAPPRPHRAQKARRPRDRPPRVRAAPRARLRRSGRRVRQTRRPGRRARPPSRRVRSPAHRAHVRPRRHGSSCNLTQIVTCQLGYCGVQWRCRWLGIDKDTHDEIARHSNDANPETHEAMTKISYSYAEQVARIANGLDNAPDASDSGTVLDSSLLVWANENATAFHSLDPLPVALIGRAGGRLTESGLIDQGEQPHYRLGTTILNLMGVERAASATRPDCGSLSGVS